MGLPHCGDIYVCEALLGGVDRPREVRAKKGRRQIPTISFSIPDFCFPDPEMQFEPIKSRVSRGLSPMEAGWGLKKFLKIST